MLEDLDGVFVDPFVAATSKFLAIDPDINFSPELFKRNIRRGTLTPQQPLIGAKPGKMTFGLEMAGSGSITQPPIGLAWQACGMRQEVLVKFTIPATFTTGTGPILHGEIFTQAGGISGMVVGDVYEGQTTMWFARLNTLGTSVPDTSLVTIDRAVDVTFTPTAVTTTNAGYGWFPASLPLSKLLFLANISNPVNNGDILRNAGSTAFMQVVGNFTAATTLTQVVARIRGQSVFAPGDVITNVTTGLAVGTLAASTANIQIANVSASMGMYKDGVREAMRGARGTFKMDGKVGEPLINSFDFSGSYQSVADGANVSGISFPTTLPPVLLNADLGLGKAATIFANEYAPCINNFGIDIGNTLSARRCMSDSSGLVGFQITDRNATFTMDPEMEIEAIWDFMGQFTGGTSTRGRMTVGSALGNMFHIQMPAMSFTQVTTGDRDGVATRQITASLNSGSQTSLTGDNELVIILPIV